MTIKLSFNNFYKKKKKKKKIEKDIKRYKKIQLSQII